MDFSEIKDVRLPTLGLSPESVDLARNITDRLKGFADYHTTEWTRPDLGEMSFTAFEYRIVKLQMLARTLGGRRLSDLPMMLLQELQSGLDQLTSALVEMRGFSLLQIAESRSDPRQMRQRILNDAEGRFTSAERVFVSAIAFLGGLGAPDEALAQENMLKLATATGQATREAGAIQKLLADAREALKSLETARHGAFFGNEATNHRWWSFWWLGATALVATGTALAAWKNYDNARVELNTNASPAGVAQLIVAKIVLFSIGISATIWCAKVYLAHRHNYVVNRHRQNSLNSFETFADTASDEATKNTVLIQAMQAIYSPQPTAYSALGAENPGGLQMIEMIRTASQPKGGG